jgi:integrase/recombinase XerC
MVRSWLVYLLDTGLSPRSVNRKISTLKSFYKFLEKEQKIITNPMSKVISPKSGSVLPEFIKQSELEKLITEIPFEDSFDGFRNKCIILTFYLTGIRVSELVGMKAEDVDMSMKQIKILGKRNKQRFVPLPHLLEITINEYLHKRSECLSEVGLENPFLFITNRGKQTYQKLVYRIINKYLAYVSTNSKKSPHTLRHSFATIMLNNGAELNSIKEILGHSNLSATQVYTHNSIEKLKTIYKQAHPRA